MHLARHMQTHERRWSEDAGPGAQMCWQMQQKNRFTAGSKKGIKTQKVMLPGARKGKDGGEWVDLAQA